MIQLFYTLLVMVITSVVTVSAVAQESNTPQTLQSAASLAELLNKIKNFEQIENKRYEARLERFHTEKKTQQKKLKQARATYKKSQALTKKLTKTFGKNERDITSIKAKLTQQSGDLGEVFGVVKQISGDVRATFNNSYITPQYSDRIAVVDKLAKGKRLPTAKELSQLWFELQREMTASAEVVRFDANVIDVRGKETQQSVMRVGNFNAFVDNKYLIPQKSNTGFVEISRQPTAQHRKLLTAFNQSTPGIASLSIDPSRGAIISLLVQRPSIQERVDQGGYVGYVIIAIGILGLLIALERIFHLGIVNRRVKRQLQSNKIEKSNPVGRVYAVYQANQDLNVEAMELKLDEEILRNMPPLERGITTIKVLAAIAPLLGLLGTVIGMIQTFQAITLFGTGDPKLMAGGITEALVTTMLGLIVAVPLILCHSMVSNRSRRLIKTVQEQSTGYVARHAEALHHSTMAQGTVPQGAV